MGLDKGHDFDPDWPRLMAGLGMEKQFWKRIHLFASIWTVYDTLLFLFDL